MSIEWLIVLAYALIYAAALALAVARRKTFPLAESITVAVIIGFAFTGLVYLATLPVKSNPIITSPVPSEIAFTIGYVIFIALLLVIRPTPKHRPGQFLKEELASLAFKLFFFVILPLAVLRLIWRTSWTNLGFSPGDVPGQLLAAGILVLLFGGFNYVAGSGAAPIRKRLYSGRQVALGLAATFTWNILETGLVEEFFFRAFLQTRLIGALGSPLAGIALTALLFGLAHAPGIYLRAGDQGGPLGEKPALLDAVLYTVIVLSATGWFTGLLYWRTQSLLAPILVHAAIDAIAHAAEFIEGLGLRK